MVIQPNQNNKGIGQAGTEAASLPAATTGSSFSGTLLIVLILAAGGVAYYLGYLDKPLAELGLVPNKGNAQQSVPAPAPIQRETIRDTNPPLVAQLEALQTRISKLETSNRDLLAITENHANQIVRQSAGGGGPVTDLFPLQLDIIDLRLRFTGDTIIAEQELGKLASSIDDGSQLGQQIKSNRQRLLGMPPRTLLLDRIDELSALISQTRLDVLKRIADAQNQKKEQLEGNWLADLFNVKHTDLELQAELVLSEQLEAATAKVRPSLLLGDSNGYTKALAEVQAASDKLRDHAKSLSTTNIAQILSELTAAGFPDAHLVLTLPNSTGL